MTVQELLDKLNVIQDKSKPVFFYCNVEYGEIIEGDSVELKDAKEYGNCVEVTY